MAEFTDDAIVLDTIPYRDRHQIVSVIAREHGVVRGVLRRARGGKAPLAAATQLLSLVRVEVWQGAQAELATFRRVEALRPSFALGSDLARSAAATVVVELILTFCPPGDPLPRQFRLADAAARALLDGRPPAAVVAYVELWVLGLGGVLPPLDACSVCGAPLKGGFRSAAADGQPLCPSCAASGLPLVDAASMEFLAACLEHPPDRLTSPPPQAAARWLDRLVRAEAHRHLKALDFFHRYS
ncbi:MAG: DNA repair protein RecO [Acidobacteria bacterium]|jgi:DNA repair protein RecO (recombination protein O)|nr:DNA repair protein RecO [Acidobacteriota bacterium]